MKSSLTILLLSAIGLLEASNAELKVEVFNLLDTFVGTCDIGPTQQQAMTKQHEHEFAEDITPVLLEIIETNKDVGMVKAAIRALRHRNIYTQSSIDVVSRAHRKNHARFRSTTGKEHADCSFLASSTISYLRFCSYDGVEEDIKLFLPSGDTKSLNLEGGSIMALSEIGTEKAAGILREYLKIAYHENPKYMKSLKSRIEKAIASIEERLAASALGHRYIHLQNCPLLK